MPFLDLPQLHLPESGVYIFAVMVSPDDPIAQKSFMASMKGKVLLDVLNKCETRDLAGSPQAIEYAIEAANAPRLEETVRQLVPSAMRGGPLAAQTLLLVLSLAAHFPHQASLGAGSNNGLSARYGVQRSPSSLKASAKASHSASFDPLPVLPASIQSSWPMSKAAQRCDTGANRLQFFLRFAELPPRRPFS